MVISMQKMAMEGEAYPTGYRPAHFDVARRVMHVYPIGIHWLVMVGIWLRDLTFRYRPHALEVAHEKGRRDGVSLSNEYTSKRGHREGYKDGWEAAYKQMLSMVGED